VKKQLIIAMMLMVVLSGCKDIKPSQQDRERAEFAAKEYAAASKRADNSDPAGYLKLYEIARDSQDIYTTEYSEIAEEKIFLLLYSNPELWVKTFSTVDLEQFKDFVKGIEVSERPKNVSNEQFKETILNNLQKIKGDKREVEVAEYILRLYNRK